ncbi:unnamed protein product [Brugia timori]|uniref:U1-type domain-containing protein n=1 Tax=Brugia timori TaxID=42155 RepID=A0A0R3QXN1_9BILA|nr:unnamed protein product [Brugia timori]
MSPIGQRYCEVCDVYITRKNFCQHLRTRRHMAMEASKKFQLSSNYEMEEPPRKKTKMPKVKKTNDEANNSQVHVNIQTQDQYPNLCTDDILHYVGQLAKPLNDSTSPCNCSICAAASKYLGLTETDPTLNYNNEENDIPEQSEQLIDDKCIDFNNTYNNLVVFPPNNSAGVNKIKTWKSIEEFAKVFNEHQVNVDIVENKENIPPLNFSTTSKPSTHPSLAFARHQSTHHCCNFGEELPEYLKFSHCHEEMFHFFGINDKRTDCNVLFVVMK